MVRGGCICEGQSDFSGPGLTQPRCTEAKILAKGVPSSAVRDKMKGSSGSISAGAAGTTSRFAKQGKLIHQLLLRAHSPNGAPKPAAFYHVPLTKAHTGASAFVPCPHAGMKHIHIPCEARRLVINHLCNLRAARSKVPQVLNFSCFRLSPGSTLPKPSPSPVS